MDTADALLALGRRGRKAKVSEVSVPSGEILLRADVPMLQVTKSYDYLCRIDGLPGSCEPFLLVAEQKATVEANTLHLTQTPCAVRFSNRIGHSFVVLRRCRTGEIQQLRIILNSRRYVLPYYRTLRKP